MTRITRTTVLVAIAHLTLCGAAFAQTTPGWYRGFVPSPGQWNAMWAGKQDTLSYVPLNRDGDSMLGPLKLTAPNASLSGLNLGVGVTPTSPNNGDLWMTTSGLFFEINGVSYGPVATGAASAGSTLSVTSDPNITLSLSGTPSTALLRGVNLTAAWSGDLPLTRGGTGQVTAQAARAFAGLNIDSIQLIGDASYTFVASDRTVGTSATLTAPRTWTLPQASTLNPGQSIDVADMFGGVNGVNIITVAAHSGDTINGVSSTSISAQWQQIKLVTDGVSRWTFNSATQPVLTGNNIFTGTNQFQSKLAFGPSAPVAPSGIDLYGYVSGLSRASTVEINRNDVLSVGSDIFEWTAYGQNASSVSQQWAMIYGGVNDCLQKTSTVGAPCWGNENTVGNPNGAVYIKPYPGTLGTYGPGTNTPAKGPYKFDDAGFWVFGGRNIFLQPSQAIGSFGTDNSATWLLSYNEAHNFNETIDAGTGIISWTAHNRIANEPIFLSGSVPPSFTTGTWYYVYGPSITANTFRLSATPGGAALSGGGAGSVAIALYAGTNEMDIQACSGSRVDCPSSLTNISLTLGASDRKLIISYDAGLTTGLMSMFGHVSFNRGSDPAPSLGTCTGGALTANSTDTSGTITGVTGASCQVVFGTSFQNTPNCGGWSSVQGQVIAIPTKARGAITLTPSSATAQDITYFCPGANEPGSY